MKSILNKPYIKDADGQPIEEPEVVIDISNLNPQKMFEILNFMDEEIYKENELSSTFQLIVLRSGYKISIPNVHYISIKKIEGNKLIFGGLTNEDGTDEVRIEIGYMNNHYPKGFYVQIVTTHHLAEEFFRAKTKV